ncbi:hypothetical protein Thiowin_04968 [Thiorhodovibrio winogradskyi]|uniref:Negative modulator of initiation of replication SeqA N-terminal domain-containing protein n=1 Tax=Thiorhodovibrio winogradskyi TaxID=77007 RepID=A0ABZ0SFM3_9GAMM|nr:hypothetical protein [Thiorhodovibrio winogradskyi]
MRQIEIDDEVFGYLQSQARAFVDTPNLTLRRLFQLEKNPPKPAVVAPSQQKTRKKLPKANLLALISSGLLQDGQSVFLVDYQDNKLTQYRAVIAGSSLKWHGQTYSMSDLAQELLKKEGYSSTSVRGPTHWCTDDGITIKTLWQQYLSKTTLANS